jgi:extracellular elastinolytic metalloproteinase
MNVRLGIRARRAVGVVSVVAVCLALVPAAANAAVATTQAAPAATAKPEKMADYDARTAGTAQKVLATRSATLAATPTAGVKALRQQLGIQGIVDLDPLTSTPRRVTKVDGFLTGPSKAAPADIALSYVRAHQDVFALSAATVSSLVLRQKYVDVEGTTHLSFIQQVNGVNVFSNGLKAHVTKNGELIQLDGSPLASLPASVTAPGLTAVAARNKAVADTFGTSKASVVKSLALGNRATTFTGGDSAQLVLFQTLSGLQLGWQTVTMTEGFIHVIDAKSGRTLFRQSIVDNDNADTWTNYPDAPKGGQAKTINLASQGWLPNNSPRLAGNVAHVYLDLNDNNLADSGEEVPPSGKKSFVYPFQPVAGPSCLPDFPCSWDPDVPFSWQTNENQDAVQLFSFLGTYHDHLNANPIGFTRSAGNFEAVDGDAVEGNALDGANTAGGLPDGNHIDNANMATPPDGTSPRMQMYLWHAPGTSFPDEEPFIAGNGGDEADIVYHEYTHGLSNRLVVDANGVSTLGGIEAGAMGEAWSDWYAMDFLVNQGLFKDTKSDGDLKLGVYVGGGDTIRSQPMDCAVGSTSAACPGTPAAGPGGYTYGDYGRVSAGPEVHADGEIWGETLWDLRTALGSKTAESLVTRALELSPSNPSFLDERNSILAADLVVNNGKNQKKIWQVFAARGMGWFAGAVDGDDSAPAEDFSLPPAPNTPTGSLTGHVTNADTGAAVSGAVVAFGGHNSGFAGSYAALTDGTGAYTISGILPGTYPKVFSRGPGYDPVVQTLSVASHASTVNWALRRDWAASAGGATIGAFTPPDYTDFGCGPINLIDQSLGAGWGSDAPTTTTPGETFPKSVVINLPVAVNITQLQIDPANTCGDAGSSSTGDFKVETSTDGVTFHAAATGHFTPAQRVLNTVPLAAGTGTGVKSIRYTMISTQVADLGGTCPGAFTGCDFMDSTELTVYGPAA